MEKVKLSVPDLDITIPPTPESNLIKEDQTREGDDEVFYIIILEQH